jgi:hypothetical protein
MLKLSGALRAWGMPDFEAALKQELARNAGHLPLQQGLSSSSSVADAPVTVVIHSMTGLGNAIRVKAGIFYQGVIGGCSCTGDPTPDSENTEYCVVLLSIDKTTAATEVTLLAE